MTARALRPAGPIRWLTEPVPRGRIAAFRTLIYLFVVVDLVLITPSVRSHAHVPAELYRPLLVGRLLPLPTPNATLIHAIFWSLLALCLVAAATGRGPRLLGIPIFLLYFEWMIIAMSYGKVDHDRVALLVALAVLPTAGRARHGDPTRTEAGGWALRMVQLAVVATYFLAAWAKLRLQGPDWATSGVLAWAIIRRGTEFAHLVAQVPYLLIAAQVGIMVFELLSPLIFVLRGRWQYRGVAFFYLFHLMTYAAITISFAPHLAAMTAFLPLERLRPLDRLRRVAGRAPAAADRPPPGEAAVTGGGTAVDPAAPTRQHAADDSATVDPVAPTGAHAAGDSATVDPVASTGQHAAGGWAVDAGPGGRRSGQPAVGGAPVEP